MKKIYDFIKKIKWDYIKRSLDLVQFLVVVIGIVFSVYQINDMLNNQLGRKNQLSIFYYDRLNSGTNKKISIAIEHNKPILKSFTDDEVDDFLNNLSGVGDNLQRKLLDEDIVCSDFSDLAIKSYKNKEIQSYIYESRKDDNAYFQDFDYLYDVLTNSCDFN